MTNALDTFNLSSHFREKLQVIHNQLKHANALGDWGTKDFLRTQGPDGTRPSMLNLQNEACENIETLCDFQTFQTIYGHLWSIICTMLGQQTGTYDYENIYLKC